MAPSKVTKYNVVPPPVIFTATSPRQPIQPIRGDSTDNDGIPPLSVNAGRPTMSIISPPQSRSTTLQLPPGSDTIFFNSERRIAQARADLAALQEATTQSASESSNHGQVQVFEVTHLRTIKCDICQRKNTNILYKCQGCALQHQICAGCVDNSEPKPADGMLGRKNWSVHAKLKGAHTAYMNQISSQGIHDGNYEKDGVRLVLAKGKKGGVKTAKKATPKRDVTASERNRALQRAFKGSRTLAQGRRLERMAQEKLDRKLTPELRERVNAHRVRSASQAASQADNKKRKADVLGDETDSGSGSVLEADGKGKKLGGGGLEEAVAAEKETADSALHGSGHRTNRKEVQCPKGPRWGTFSSPRRVPIPISCELEGCDSVSSVRSITPHPAQANQTSIMGAIASKELFIRGSGGGPAIHLFLAASSSPHQPDEKLIQSEMRSTARRHKIGKPSMGEPSHDRYTAHPVTGKHPPPPNDDDTQSEDTPGNSPTRRLVKKDDTQSVDTPGYSPTKRLAKNRRYSDSPLTPTPGVGISRYLRQHRGAKTTDHQAKEQPKKIEAREEQKKVEAERALQQREAGSDPLTKDRQGIDLLQQAARVVEDQGRERRRVEMARRRRGRRDRSPSGDEADDEVGEKKSQKRAKDASAPESLRKPRRLPQVAFTLVVPGPSQQTTSTAPSRPILPMTQGDGTQERRRSDRLASTTSSSTTRRPHSSRNTRNAIPPASDPATEAALARIQATLDHHIELGKGKGRPVWSPLVQSYLNEQEKKREKTRRWLAEHGDDDGSGEDDGEEDAEYDKGVEGGVWVESEGSEADEEDNPEPNVAARGAGTGGNGKERRERRGKGKGKEKGKAKNKDELMRNRDEEIRDPEQDAEVVMDVNEDKRHGRERRQCRRNQPQQTR